MPRPLGYQDGEVVALSRMMKHFEEPSLRNSKAARNMHYRQVRLAFAFGAQK